jgi:hypothetical protein
LTRESATDEIDSREVLFADCFDISVSLNVWPTSSKNRSAVGVSLDLPHCFADAGAF